MADKTMHMVGNISNGCKMKEINKIDCTILDHFTKLRDENESKRVEGGIELLKYLHQQTAHREDSREFKYAMKRLIRSLGSSKNTSKMGFYTTLTVFLTMNPEKCMENFLSIVDDELHPVNSNSKSETADIYMGCILAYGALIRSKILLNSTIDIQLRVIKNLVNAGMQRSYLSFVSISFLVEFINQIDVESIRNSVWPVVEKQFGKSWAEQTLDSFYVLLSIRSKCPSLVDNTFSIRHFGTETIITKQSMASMVKVLLDLQRVVSYQHPIFKLFLENLNTTELIVDFWSHIDKKFTKPSRGDEYIGVQTLQFLLQSNIDNSVFPSLLSPNYIQHMLRKFSASKNHNKDEILGKFKEVLNLLISSIIKEGTKLKTQIATLKKLIMYPGDLMIEKKTGTKIIQTLTGNMNADGIKKVSKIYRDIIQNAAPKEGSSTKAQSFWTNTERIYAVHLLTRLMGQPKMLVDKEWRLDQLKFLFTYGLCEISNVGVDLAPQFKDTFYHALDQKLPKLNDLRNILSELVHFLDDSLKKQELKLRNPLTDEVKSSWQQVMNTIDNLENNSKRANAVPIFHTMNLHMGLQLFSDPKMAITAINELQSCYKRVLIKSKKGTKLSKKEVDDEPEWVEVVVDLLLSFYSKNSHLLRSLVRCVFPHICPYVTPAAVHQILRVLDVRNEKGLLVAESGSNLEEEEEEDDSSESESNLDDEDDKDNEDDQSAVENTNDEMETSTDNDSDANEESMNEDEDDTVTDRLRMAVRQALGDASLQTDDEDVDVDNIDEEEGKRLNESLAAAFRILRENRQSRTKKQEKSAQALTHFRIRVIDLLETYLEHGPSMAIVLDMLLPLVTLLEYCIKDPHQKPLQDRARSCIKTMATLKKFKDVDNVDEELLIVILKALIEKGERTTSVYHEMSDKLSECCTFLVRCAQHANTSTDVLINVYAENLTTFFRKRDCVLSPLLFKSILQLQWEGNWQLAPMLVDFSFDNTIRSFRRGYALEFLTVFYNNSRLVHLDTKHTDIRVKMEKKLCKNTISTLQELCAMHNFESARIPLPNNNEIGKEVRQRYMCLLLTLLRTVHPHHIPQAWKWDSIGKVLQAYRACVSLAKDTKVAYNKLVNQIGISTNAVIHSQFADPNLTPFNFRSRSQRMLKKNHNVPMNGQTKDMENNEHEMGMETVVEELRNTQENGSAQNTSDDAKSKASIGKKKKKNKSKQRDKQLLKKEARILREKAMSEGFKPFNFSSFALNNESTDEVLHQNGNTRKEQTSPNCKKRTLKSISDSDKSKRRKSIQAD